AGLPFLHLDVFDLPEDVVQKMQIPKPFQIREEPERPQLSLSGTLAFDPDYLARIQSRFPGDLMEVGNDIEPGSDKFGKTLLDQPLRYGSAVTEGQLLAVVWSKELGEKKSE